jgi:heme oxygenase
MPLTLATSSIAQVVKNETACAHRDVEEVLLPALQSIHSLRDCADILKAFYGFFQPTEESIRQYITPSILPDIEKRRNASLITGDLLALKSSGDLPLCSSLPQIKNSSQAFGALYVLEGSTLGGRIITKMLAKNKDVAIPSAALNFFGGYKEETGKMWTAFVDALNKQKDTGTIVLAANETFYHLKNWMQKALAHDKTN